MRPQEPPREIVPPPPSAYVERMPIFPTSDSGAGNRRFERKRLWRWFGVAVALHAALLIGIWLTPSLRIKWEPSPEAWVPVTSLPVTAPAAAVPPGPSPEPAKKRAQRRTVAPRKAID